VGIRDALAGESAGEVYADDVEAAAAETEVLRLHVHDDLISRLDAAGQSWKGNGVSRRVVVIQRDRELYYALARLNCHDAPSPKLQHG
jgi:hypothetical protein